MTRKIKCILCGKKLPGYMELLYTCKCKKHLCNICKTIHDCSFDYKGEFKKIQQQEIDAMDKKNGNLSDRI